MDPLSIYINKRIDVHHTKSGTGRWTSRDRSWKSDKERTAFRAILAGHAPSPWPPSCFGHRTSPRRRRRLSNPLSGLGAGLAAATPASWWCVGRAANCRLSTASPPLVDPSPLVSSSSSASPSLPLRVRILVFLIFLSRRFTGERWMLMLLLYLYCQRLLTFFFNSSIQKRKQGASLTNMSKGENNFYFWMLVCIFYCTNEGLLIVVYCIIIYMWFSFFTLHLLARSYSFAVLHSNERTDSLFFFFPSFILFCVGSCCSCTQFLLNLHFRHSKLKKGWLF